MELGLLHTIGLNQDAAEHYNDAINHITPQQIQQAAQRYFQENNRTEVELVPHLERKKA